MYNTDRDVIYVGVPAFVDFLLEDPYAESMPGLRYHKDMTEVGKEWSRGYGGYRPHRFRNMGTENGKHPWDVRVFLHNLHWLVFKGHDWLWGYYKENPPT